MGISHIALAVKDIDATHRFYTESMGFTLVKTEVVPKRDGFRRHLFYSTGPTDDQLIAFWDMGHDPTISELRTDLNRDLGLPDLTNHFAFTADDLDDLERRKHHWLAQGHVVLEIDHGWITSIYTEDPDGNPVEFAVTTRAFTDADASEAQMLLASDNPPASGEKPRIQLHDPNAVKA